MSEDRIDSIIDLKATQAEVDALEAQLKEVVSMIQQVKGAGIGAKGATSNSDLAAKTKEISTLNIRLAESHKQVEQLVKARFAAEAKLTTLQTDYAKATATARTEIQAKNREMKIESELQLSSTGSIGRAEAAIKKLTLERKNLNLFTAEGKKRLEEINVALNRYTNFIKKNNDEAGKQRLNIGNYQGSAKLIIDALERTRAKVVQVDRAFGAMSPEGQAVRRELEAIERITSNPQFLNVSAKIGDATAESRFFTKALIDLERNGQGSSEAANKLRAQLAKLSDEIRDTRQEVKALSSDTRNFDLFAGSVKFLASSWQAAAGAAQLFGENNEDVQKSIQRLVAIQSVAQGVQQVATELTTKGTAANKAYNFILEQGNLLFGKGIPLAQRFGAALKGVVVLAVIGFAIQFVKSLKDIDDGADDAKKSLEGFNDQIQRTKQFLSEFDEDDAQRFLRQLEDLKRLNIERLKGAKTETERIKIEKENKKSEFDAELKFKQTHLRELEARQKNFNDKEIAATQSHNVLVEGLKKRGVLNEAKDLVQVSKDKIALIAKENEEAKRNIKKAQDDLLLFQRQGNTKRSEEELADFLKAQEEKEAEAKRIAEADRAAQFEIFKLEQELQAEVFKQIADDENKSHSERLLALNQYAKTKQAIIDATAEYELQNAELTSEEIRLVEKKRIDSTLRLQLELSEGIKRTVRDFQQATPAMKDAVDGMTKSIAAAIDAIQKKNNELKDGLEKNLKAIKDATKQLASEVSGLLFDLFTNSIDREKNAIQDQIDLLDKKKQKDIEVANQTITNAQDRAAAIAVIEARANAQKEQLERKQRELDQRKARFERAEAIVNIIANTARGITAALASVPPNPILAAIVGAIGAVQLARTLAQPIPKFAKGGVHKGGLMEVGDAGRSEGILLPDGSLLKSPSKSTIMDAPAGTKIFQDYDKMMLNATITKVPEFRVKTLSDGTKEAINKVGKDIVRAIKNQPQTTFKGEPRWKVMTRTGSTFRTYLDNNL